MDNLSIASPGIIKLGRQVIIEADEALSVPQDERAQAYELAMRTALESAVYKQFVGARDVSDVVGVGTQIIKHADLAGSHAAETETSVKNTVHAVTHWKQLNRMAEGDIAGAQEVAQELEQRWPVIGILSRVT